MNAFKQLMFGSLITASPWRIFKSVLVILLLTYLGLMVLLFFFQRGMLYFPAAAIEQKPSDFGLDYEELWLPVDNETEQVHAWSIPAAPENDTGRWILFCHGNAGNIGDRLPVIEILHRLGFSTLIFDYRGFGRSTGRPSEKNTYQDAAAAWDWLVSEKGVEKERIMIFGRSLGGAVATWLAREKNPGLLVVESTFTSIADMGRELYPIMPVNWLVRYRYPVREYMADYEGPVLIMHSHDDELVPMEMGRELYEVAPGEKKFFELRGGHNEVWFIMGEEYEKLLLQGIEELWPAL